MFVQLDRGEFYRGIHRPSPRTDCCTGSDWGDFFDPPVQQPSRPLDMATMKRAIGKANRKGQAIHAEIRKQNEELERAARKLAEEEKVRKDQETAAAYARALPVIEAHKRAVEAHQRALRRLAKGRYGRFLAVVSNRDVWERWYGEATSAGLIPVIVTNCADQSMRPSSTCHSEMEDEAECMTINETGWTQLSPLDASACLPLFLSDSRPAFHQADHE